VNIFPDRALKTYECQRWALFLPSPKTGMGGEWN
jgi:hypothetical protein